MEVPGMDEVKKSEDHMTSAAAFVEGGIQDACDDACSICLEAFCDSDPSTITSCKHEFHLQCILEWCQRSSNCPMCWQAIRLKDASSQELLEAVERERTFRLNPPRNSTIFHHPALGDFELQHLPVGASSSELEERIIQHLAAAAAMGRARRTARREGSRTRSSSRPQLVVFSNADSVSSSLGPAGGESEQQMNLAHVQTDQTNRQLVFAPNQDRAGPSDFQSFSESLKTRFNAMSMRYKETISKSTRGWRERLFSRNAPMDGDGVPPEGNSGISNISRMMERLQAAGGDDVAPPARASNDSATDRRDRSNEGNNPEAIVAGSASN